MWRPREHPALSRWLAAGRGGRRAGAGRAPSGPPPALPGTSPLPLPPPCPPAGLGYFSTFWSRPRECFHASPLVPADWEPSGRMSHRVSPSVAGHGCDLGLRSGWRVRAPPGPPLLTTTQVRAGHVAALCRPCVLPLPLDVRTSAVPSFLRPLGKEPWWRARMRKASALPPRDSRARQPLLPRPDARARLQGAVRGVRTLPALPRRPPQPPRAHCLAGSPETVVVPRDTGRPGSRSRGLWPQAGLSPGARPPRQLGTASPTQEVAGGRGPSLPAAPSP